MPHPHRMRLEDDLAEVEANGGTCARGVHEAALPLFALLEHNPGAQSRPQTEPRARRSPRSDPRTPPKRRLPEDGCGRGRGEARHSPDVLALVVEGVPLRGEEMVIAKVWGVATEAWALCVRVCVGCRSSGVVQGRREV